MAWREFILNNLGRKLFSLCLATLIWFNIWSVIRNEPRPLENPLRAFFAKPTSLMQAEFEKIPIVVRSLAQDSRGYKLDARQVKIIVSGEREVVRGLTTTNIQALIDLTDLSNAEKSDPKAATFARPVQVQAPDGVTIVKVDPSAVQVEPLPTPAPAVKPAD